VEAYEGETEGAMSPMERIMSRRPTTVNAAEGLDPDSPLQQQRAKLIHLIRSKPPAHELFIGAGTSTEDDKKAIAHLAKLDTIDYERARKVAAKELGLRESALDRCVARERTQAGKRAEARSSCPRQTKVWPKKVEGAGLLDQITREIERYVVLREGEAELLAIWTVLTHARDLFFVSPRLWLQSAEPGCGKSTTMNVLSHLVLNPVLTTSLTAAAVFREIDLCKPTLLIDEAEPLLDSLELIAILNSGYHRNSASVVRAGSSGRGAQRFSTFAPVAIATIDPLPPTLASRAIRLALRPPRPNEQINRLDEYGIKALRDLSRQAARWVSDNDEQISKAQPRMPDFLVNRAADNWMPLVAIAEVAAGDWPKRTTEIAQLSANKTEPVRRSRGVMLMADVRDHMLTKGVMIISGSDMATELSALEDRPWGNWNERGPITPREIANLLAPYDITPIKVQRGRSEYRTAQLKEAFARYLAPKERPSFKSSTTKIPFAMRVAAKIKQIPYRLVKGAFRIARSHQTRRSTPQRRRPLTRESSKARRR
jgi:putative DNA primase/helicase